MKVALRFPVGMHKVTSHQESTCGFSVILSPETLKTMKLGKTALMLLVF